MRLPFGFSFPSRRKDANEQLSIANRDLEVIGKRGEKEGYADAVDRLYALASFDSVIWHLTEIQADQLRALNTPVYPPVRTPRHIRRRRGTTQVQRGTPQFKQRELVLNFRLSFGRQLNLHSLYQLRQQPLLAFLAS